MPLEETENTIPDEYVVVFKETATEFDGIVNIVASTN